MSALSSASQPEMESTVAAGIYYELPEWNASSPLAPDLNLSKWFVEVSKIV
jgi:hypothetical protein